MPTSVNQNIFAIVLAAGKGTRMHSALPKVLQTLLGEPMLKHVYSAIKPIFKDKIYAVIGHGAAEVEKALKQSELKFVVQSEQLGTGHAVSVCLSALKEAKASHIVVINGDTPLITADSIERFLAHCNDEKPDLAFISLTLDDPGSFGRVLYKEGQVQAIIEAKDYDVNKHGAKQNDINAGIYFLNLETIAPLFQLINNKNKSGEYYITDLVGLAKDNNLKVTSFNDGKNPELLGINSPIELAESEELLRAKIVRALLQSGVIIHAPNTVQISAQAVIEPGVEIFGPCKILGNTLLKKGCKIEAFCHILDSQISENTVIRAFSHLEGAQIASDCIVGPYGRIRPESILEEGSHVGNFVELKKTRLGKKAKANHLSYLGDSEIGAGTNIGAGTITCNYDGKNKYKTIIGENAFIGSNSSLVAPLVIGAGALIGAGSTITKDVPESCLAVARQRQSNLERKK